MRVNRSPKEVLMTHGPLPRVARENLRRATLHILALKPGATEIAFIDMFADTGSKWNYVQFKHNECYGVAALDMLYPGHIGLKHPYEPALWHYNTAPETCPIGIATTKILAKYPEATDIEMKGRHRLYFTFINEGEKGMYQPKNDIHDKDFLIWPTLKMGPSPTGPSAEFLKHVIEFQKKD